MTQFTSRSYRLLGAFVAVQIALFALVRTEVALSTPISTTANASTLADIRPSWENNLNWWIDGGPAVAVLQQTGELP